MNDNDLNQWAETNLHQTICAVCKTPHPLQDLVGTCQECREGIRSVFDDGVRVERERTTAFLQSVADAPLKMQLIMRDNNLVMDDITSPQGKLAFTVYTRLCELSMQAIQILKKPVE